MPRPSRMPFHYYHPTLRAALQRLVDVEGFDPDAIVDAAEALARLMAEHGPKRTEVSA